MLKVNVSRYHKSTSKLLFDYIFAILGILLLSPLLLGIIITIKLSSTGPVIFKQTRVKQNGKKFKIFMFRTMYQGAEKDQAKFAKQNEADGPVFKIRNDPRFVGIGRFLAWSGFDETPQLINVIRGEMRLVGPRPLPLKEAKKLSSSQRVRELVKPGMTSSWVVNGSHNLSFNQWMKLDRKYVGDATLATDINILIKTILFIPKLLFR